MSYILYFPQTVYQYAKPEEYIGLGFVGKAALYIFEAAGYEADLQRHLSRPAFSARFTKVVLVTADPQQREAVIQEIVREMGFCAIICDRVAAEDVAFYERLVQLNVGP